MLAKRVSGVSVLAVLLLAGCGGSSPVEATAQGGVTPTEPQNLDRSCDLAPYPSAQWTACEATNYARVLEAPGEEVANVPFVLRWTEQSVSNAASYIARDTADPSWLIASSPPLSQLIASLGDAASIGTTIQNIIAGLQADPASALSLSLNTPVTPLCATWSLQCSGDPYRYPGVPGPDGDSFYQQAATVTPVVFYDRNCARLSGRVWLPGTASGATLPGVVFTNGSIEAPETVYWWAAQALVRVGYAVLTYDPRGQGRSDLEAPDLEQGSNLNPKVFWEGQVDAIDFFRSTPAKPYPYNASCAGTYPTQTAAYNPIWQQLDPARLGIAGHSLGAIGVSVVQGYGAPGADPWPGKIDSSNPVKAAVALDSLITPAGAGFAPVSDLPLPNALATALTQIGSFGYLPKFGPRAPSMSFNADYGLAPVLYVAPPPAEDHKQAFAVWQAAGVPAYIIGIQGTTHFDFSLLPTFPATSWCPDTSNGACTGGWGSPAITAYLVAWFDRWLKLPGEPGYADADQRLVDDAGPQGAVKFSFRYYSARDYPDHSGKRQHCEDIRAGCS